MNIGTILLVVYLTIGVVIVTAALRSPKMREKYSNGVLLIVWLIAVITWLPALLLYSKEE